MISYLTIYISFVILLILYKNKEKIMKVLLKLFIITFFSNTINALELSPISGEEQEIILEDFENLPALQDNTQEKQEYEEISYLDYALNKKLPQVLLDIILA